MNTQSLAFSNEIVCIINTQDYEEENYRDLEEVDERFDQEMY